MIEQDKDATLASAKATLVDYAASRGILELTKAGNSGKVNGSYGVQANENSKKRGREDTHTPFIRTVVGVRYRGKPWKGTKGDCQIFLQGKPCDFQKNHGRPCYFNHPGETPAQAAARAVPAVDKEHVTLNAHVHEMTNDDDNFVFNAQGTLMTLNAHGEEQPSPAVDNNVTLNAHVNDMSNNDIEFVMNAQVKQPNSGGTNTTNLLNKYPLNCSNCGTPGHEAGIYCPTWDTGVRAHGYEFPTNYSTKDHKNGDSEDEWNQEGFDNCYARYSTLHDEEDDDTVREDELVHNHEAKVVKDEQVPSNKDEQETSDTDEQVTSDDDYWTMYLLGFSLLFSTIAYYTNQLIEVRRKPGFLKFLLGMLWLVGSVVIGHAIAHQPTVVAHYDFPAHYEIGNNINNLPPEKVIVNKTFLNIESIEGNSSANIGRKKKQWKKQYRPPPGYEWCFDSGTNRFITNDIEDFVPGSIIHKNSTVNVGSGVTISPMVGTVMIRSLDNDCVIKCMNVLYLPDCAIKLMPACKFLDKGCIITMQKPLVEMRSKEGELMMNGCEFETLYYYHCETVRGSAAVRAGSNRRPDPVNANPVMQI